jgi:hypothetical protein
MTLRILADIVWWALTLIACMALVLAILMAQPP